ncbi:sugar transferase [Desulfovibrio litoralis]|uniref:Sugar transferase, PEP-CTERM system associated/exopolysaccharide biosynthesis polyprenyl glycosylphosphotransferase n=1 Tax=Desulfovibrio litoralis DSM 11393 TaxID=1121455 RepID=A0A1M7S7W4_9BACT|nr:sugar transferase [Desulfovibrio litoralis]SHN54475.1 sugar transferase, PEP-CTERM system associated/exopolysaccharide biosynthesis polyprenyl glycosylphosphotransferase [Desulfovibrio litoralis DSM 11393]
MDGSRKFWFILLDIFCILFALEIAAVFLLPQDWSLLTDYTGATTFTVLLFMLSFYIMDCYNIGHEDVKDSMIRLGMGIFIGTLLTTGLFYFLDNWRFPRTLFLIQMFLNMLFAGVWRLIYIHFSSKLLKKQRVLLLGVSQADRVAGLLKKYAPDAELVGYLGAECIDDVNAGQHLGSVNDVLSIIEQRKVTRVIMLDEGLLSPKLAKELFNARLSGLGVDDMFSLYQRLTKRIPVDLINDNWLLHQDGFNLNVHKTARRFKRAFDILISTFMFILLLPFLAIVALIIRLETPGSPIYTQKRVGLQGKIFTVYKLRSMGVDAEKDGAKWAEKSDPRVTRVGRFIRKTRIDELPQLFNVLKGDMSLIGPRPERPEFVAELEKQIPYFYVRHSVKPGITGWAQVLYPYGSSLEDARYKLEYDFYYIKYLSTLLEIKIILKTIGVVLFPKGAR